MSIAEELATKLAVKGLGTLGTDVFFGRFPDSAISGWQVIARGGTEPSGGNVWKWRQDYSLEVRYYNKSSQALYDAEQTLMTALSYCEEFDNSSVIEVLVSPMTDNDMSASELKSGSWNVTIKTIKEK